MLTGISGFLSLAALWLGCPRQKTALLFSKRHLQRDIGTCESKEPHSNMKFINATLPVTGWILDFISWLFWNEYFFTAPSTRVGSYGVLTYVTLVSSWLMDQFGLISGWSETIMTCIINNFVRYSRDYHFPNHHELLEDSFLRIVWISQQAHKLSHSCHLDLLGLCWRTGFSFSFTWALFRVTSPPSTHWTTRKVLLDA